MPILLLTLLTWAGMAQAHEINLKLNIELTPGGEVISLDEVDADIEVLDPNTLRFHLVDGLNMRIPTEGSGRFAPKKSIKFFDLQFTDLRAEAILGFTRFEALDVVTFKSLNQLHQNFVNKLRTEGKEHFLGPGFLDLPPIIHLNYLALDLAYADLTEPGVHKAKGMRFGGRRVISDDGDGVHPEVIEHPSIFISRVSLDAGQVQEILRTTKWVFREMLERSKGRPTAKILQFAPRPRSCENEI